MTADLYAWHTATDSMVNGSVGGPPGHPRGLAAMDLRQHAAQARSYARGPAALHLPSNVEAAAKEVHSRRFTCKPCKSSKQQLNIER